MKESRRIILAALVVGGLVITSRYNYLLFHSLAEMFSIVVAFAIFIISFNSWDFNTNKYLKFIGIAYLFIGMLDLLHTLAYKNMGVFPNFDADLPTQLWIVARYMESISLALGLVIMNRIIKPRTITYAYSAITALLLLSIFYFRIFPQCYVEGVGLTSFKVFSEYVISTIYVFGIVLLVNRREYFEKNIYHMLLASMLMSIVSEIAFTYYVSVFGSSNLVGHIFKLFSFYLVYLALVDTGLRRPYSLLYRDLNEYKDLLEKQVDQKDILNREIHHRIKNNLVVITSLLTLQSRQIEDAAARSAFDESRSRIKAISMLHEELYRTQDVKSIDMKKYIDKLVNIILFAFKADDGKVDYISDVSQVTVDVDIAMPCGLIVNELVTNALKYAFTGRDDGQLRVQLNETMDGYRLAVHDNGNGFKEGLDILDASSFGMGIVNTLVKQLGANMSVSQDDGAHFEIAIPKREYS
jgi:two-component sensor histidine kinase